MGGRAYVVGYAITMSLIHPFVGLGVDTTEGGWYDVFGCTCTDSVSVAGFRLHVDGRVGGGFGCPVIESFTMLAEATAFVIGAAAEVTRLGGGGLIQPEWAGWLMVLAGSSGAGVSSSVSNR